MRHLVETVILWIVTGAMTLYFVVFLLALWADRPMIGRDELGRPRVARGR